MDRVEPNDLKQLPGVALRLARPDDCPQLLRLARSLGSRYSFGDFTSAVYSPKRTVLVAECLDSGRVRGFAVLAPVNQEIYVQEMVASDPLARAKIINKIRDRGTFPHCVAILWVPPEY